MEDEILQYLYDNDTKDGNNIDITDFLISKFSKDDSNTGIVIADILTHLSSKGLIKADGFSGLTQSSIAGVKMGGHTLSEIKAVGKPVAARMLPDGRREIENRVFSKQVYAVNQSVIDTNKSVRRTNIWTPVIAFVTVVITGVSLFTELTKQKEQDKILQQLQKKVQSLDSTQQILATIYKLGENLEIN